MDPERARHQPFEHSTPRWGTRPRRPRCGHHSLQCPMCGHFRSSVRESDDGVLQNAWIVSSVSMARATFCAGVLTRTGDRGRVRRRGEDVGRCNRVVRCAPGSGPSLGLHHRGRVSASGDDAGDRERGGGSLAMRSPQGWALAGGERAGTRAVRRQRTGRVDQAFFVGPALVDGDFGLSRLRYDSPSITRS
jgi:hypothetical protein